ncbi:MAG: phospho-N-acetylmuramoyl-pentapeptide-transferase [Saprospiraceae bacterium]|nr:phospho-N-acetylmuramoyl-pentapeptide-transferase [Saprospiraceae bacterium]NNK90083.1 phospho-N-acetylmuramoyl-pentapeptide-transferase [Saprospiraceae bacterium]
MLYHLFEYLENQFNLPGAGLFQFISFRSALAVIISLMITLLFGNRIIRSLKLLQVGESVRDLGLDGQKQKEGTPTMGGVIIMFSIVVPTILLARLDNIYIILMLVTTLWISTIGFIDDYIKVFKKDKGGLSGKFKVFGQVVLGLMVAVVMLMHDDITIRMPLADANERGLEVIESFEVKVPQVNDLPVTTEMAYVKAAYTTLPFIKNNQLNYSFFTGGSSKWVWIIFIPLVIFIVTAVSNGANLTDGLDGLLTGIAAIIGATLGVLAYVSGNTITADYLDIFYLPHSEELVIFMACFIGACIGFLWFNSYPASVFMGDTGSLAIGGIIAVMAVLLRKELLIPILCGIILMENLSVVMQVAWFKYTKKKYGEGRRIFLMSPLHHHYQKKGMHEMKIVVRFWIVAIILAVLTVITLKIR